MRNELTILYHSVNSAEVNDLLKDLKGYNIDIATYSEKDFKYNLLELCETIKSPVLLMLSHNWLTDEKCLYNSLSGLKLLHENKQLFVTITDGLVTEGGISKTKSTEIAKVRDVIPYMKHWQEAFLEARYQRINNNTEENAELERIVKAISLTLGDMINFFRPLHPRKFRSLIGSNYQPVFDYFNMTVEVVENQDSFVEKAGVPIMTEAVPAATNAKNEISHSLPEKETTIENVPTPKKENTPQKTTVSVKGKATDPTQKTVNQDITEPSKDALQTTPTVEPTVPAQEDPTIQETPAIALPTKSIKEQANGKVKDTPPEVVQEAKKIDSNPNLGVDEVLEKAVELFNSNQDDEAYQLFEQAIRYNPKDNALLRYYYAYYLAQRKSAFDEAIHQLDTILLYDPKNDNAYFLLAELAEIKENFALAKNYYLQTQSLNPDYPQINYRIGTILQEHFQDSDEEAAKYFQEEIKKDPENTDAIYRLGIYFSEVKNDLDQAEQLFLQVLEQDEAHAFANYDLALIYHKKGDAFKAAYYYTEGCNNNPELKTEQNDLAFLAPATEKTTQAPTPESVAPNIEPVETKTIFITGATSGIGLATAEKFAIEGHCRLILSGRRRNRLVQIKNAIEDNYEVDVEILQFDVRDHLAVKEAINSLTGPFGHIDVLINNAGLALGLASIASGDLTDWETMIDTNIKGLLYTTKEVTPLMIAQNGGHIINVGSIAGREAYPNGNVYNATKAAVDMLTKAIRLDLHKYNIRVGQIAPGHVETEFALNRFHGDAQKAKIYEDFTPLSAPDIANIIYFMINQPEHVNIQDVLVFPTQQASATVINRSGRYL